MEQNKRRNDEYLTIDVMHIAKTLFYRGWILILAGIVAAAAGFGYSAFMIKPDYSSSILLYVNNGGISVGGFDISASDLVASQSLVKTYRELLVNRTTLEKVQAKSGLSYTSTELAAMIKAESSNETEVMKITVTTKNADEAALIANTIAEVLPQRISEIIDGATVAVVDDAVPKYQKVSPNITRNTAIAMLIGVFLAAAVIVVMAIMDDTIHDEEYVIQNYDYPILAKVPNLLSSNAKSYAYNYYRKSSSSAKK